MNGQMKNYDDYAESLKQTPGPFTIPKGRVINLKLLYEYLRKSGKKANELSQNEYEPFWVERTR